MVDIRPDPAHPRGGYACITLDANAISGTEVSLTIRNQFNDKYLGQDGWQGVKAYFGPYVVETSGDTAKLVVGTEIVNHLEEYTPLSIGIDGKEFEASWPDDIAQGPPAARVGGVAPSPQARAADTGPNLVGKAKDAPEEATEAEEPEQVETTPSDTDSGVAPKAGGDSDQQKSKTGLFAALGVLLLALIGGGAYWLMTQDPPPEKPEIVEEEKEETEEVVVVKPVPVPVPSDPCSDDALETAVGDGYGVLVDLLGQCSSSVSADTALILIERGVAQEDAQALAMMGHFYDGSIDIDALEKDMGLTFADNPPRAAEYYARAVKAGDGVGAAEALADVCERLQGAGDTLSQSAMQDYCQASQ
ncbi:MAG: hypothetical protein AAFO72_04680 [Pseudomonadota bacterium]